MDTTNYRATPGELSRLIWKDDYVWREQKPDGTLIEYALDPNDNSRALPRWLRVDRDVIELEFSQYDGDKNTYNHIDLNYLHGGKGYPVTLQRTNEDWKFTDWNGEAATLHVSDGKLTKVEDSRTGTLAQLAYGSQGVTSVTDPDNYITRFTYNSSTAESHFGELTSFTDAESHTTGLSFDLTNRTSSLTNPRNAVWHYEHDGQGITKVTDPGPNNGVSGLEYAVTVTDYEGEHYLLHQRDGNGHLGSYWNFQFAYDGIGNRTESTDAEGVTTYFWYNDDRKVIGTRVGPGSLTDPTPNPGAPAPGDPNPQPTELGPYTIYQYADVHQSVPGGYWSYPYGGDQGGWRTNSNYGGYRPLIRLRNILSGEYNTTYQYDMYGRVIAAIDPRGYATHYEYYRLDGDYFRKRATDPLNQQTSFDYDKEGDLRRTIDPIGCTTLHEYDKRHLPTLVTDPQGRTQSMTYDQRGNLLQAQNQRGYTTEHQYDGLSRNVQAQFPLEFANSDQAVTQTHFDAAGNLDWTEDANSHRTTYDHYDTNWLKTTTDAAGNTVTYYYDVGGRQIEVDDPRGNPSQTVYDRADRVTESKVLVDADLSVRGVWIDRATIGYDGAGREFTVADGRGFTTSKQYDRVNRLRVVEHPLSDAKGKLTTEYTYDPNRNQIAVKDANDQVAWSSYDALDRLEWSEDQLGNRTAYAYEYITGAPWDAAFNGQQVTVTDPCGDATVQYSDCTGRLARIRDANGQWTIFAYDDNGNRTAVRDANGNWTYFGYDAFDRLVWVSQPTTTERANPESLPRAQELEYDKAGNVTATSTPKATSGTPAMNRTEFTYDAIDRRTKVRRYLGATGIDWLTAYDDATNTRTETDPLGLAVNYQHDALDRLRYVKWTESGTARQTEYQYDATDNRTAQIDANGNTTNWTHDAMNRMTQETDAAGNARLFGYDGVGNVILRTDAEGRITNYARDAAGAETARIYGTYQAADSKVRGGRIDTTYDECGDRKTAQSVLGGWEWTYDSLHRMTGRAEPPIGISDPNYGQLVTLWYYDAHGNLTRLVGPDGGLTDYAYDERNRMTTVTRKDTETDPSPRIATYDYYDNNLLKLKTLPNGCEAYHEYDELDRLTLLVNRKSDGTVISSFAIEYRADDNKSQITREDGTVITYDYDDQKRLTEEKWTASGGTVLHHFQYTYDPAGNRLTKVYNGVTTSYEYNSVNELTQETTGGAVTEYGYDRDGNTVRKAEPTRTTLFTWDQENMLTRAEFDDGTTTNEFSYDADSVRVEKVDSGGRKQYHWDGTNAIVERTGENVLISFALESRDLVSRGSIVAQVDAGVWTYYHHSPPRTVIQGSDEDQSVLEAVATNSFGDIIAGIPTILRRSFVEKEFDHDGQLYHFFYRLYAPSIGRFYSMDPVLETLGHVVLTFQNNSYTDQHSPYYLDRNPFTYTTNNPTRFVDPLGLWPDDGQPWNTSDIAAYRTFVKRYFARMIRTGQQVDPNFGPNVLSIGTDLHHDTPAVTHSQVPENLHLKDSAWLHSVKLDCSDWPIYVLAMFAEARRKRVILFGKRFHIFFGGVTMWYDSRHFANAEDFTAAAKQGIAVDNFRRNTLSVPGTSKPNPGDMYSFLGNAHHTAIVWRTLPRRGMEPWIDTVNGDESNTSDLYWRRATHSVYMKRSTDVRLVEWNYAQFYLPPEPIKAIPWDRSHTFVQ